MAIELLFVIYILLIVIAISLEVYLLTTDKSKYMRDSLMRLSRLLERNVKMDDVDLAGREIKRLYIQYTREFPKSAKYYSNIIVWLDAVIFRIDTYKKVPQTLLENERLIKEVREMLEIEIPFYQCVIHQQEILGDIRELENEDNKIVVKNILARAEAEFLRQNIDNRRNRIINIVSVIIGVVGILVSLIN